jgi:hypothetical protein
MSPPKEVSAKFRVPTPAELASNSYVQLAIRLGATTDEYC